MPRKYVVLIIIASVVVFADQWTKFLVVHDLTTRMDGLDGLSQKLSALYTKPPPEGLDGNHFRTKRTVTVSRNFFRIKYAENPGAAWGLFRNLPEEFRGPLFHVVSIGAVILIGYYFTKLSGKDPAERLALWGLSLVLGGALGNYIDRLARGFVVDYLEAHWYDKAAWPVFNLADSAICVGIAMLLLDSFLRKEKKNAAVQVRSRAA